MVKTLPSKAGGWVPSLVGELRSHMPKVQQKKKKRKENLMKIRIIMEGRENLMR